jgi:hypothetical protein
MSVFSPDAAIPGTPLYERSYGPQLAHGYYPYEAFYEGPHPYDECDALLAMVHDVVRDLVDRRAPPPPPRPVGAAGAEYLVGWSQPPRPADVVVSFNPRASARDQARAVLYDYYHDDPLRYWSDNEAVKRCFIGGKDPRKENHDVLLLIAAYENKNHSVWKCHGTGMTWVEMNKAVQQAIAHRRKLGPLPKSSYDTNPVVIYYYDNDKMKRITYPMRAVPNALDPVNNSWWATPQQDNSDAAVAAGLDDIHTRETDDPKKIAVERANPGWITQQQKQALKSKYPWLSDMKSGSAGDWTYEGFTYDKDWVGKGIWGTITGAVMAVVTAIGSAVTFGIAAAPLGALSAVAVAAVNAADTALHAGDFGAALAQLGPALIQAAVSAAGSASGAAGFNIPPAALKALGSTLGTIAKDLADAQQKKGADFGEMWAEVAKKAQSYSKIGEDQAEAIAHLISGQSATAGHVFIQGYLAGKFLDSKALSGIGNILKAYSAFADPRIINIALLGMGLGHIAAAQQGSASVSGSFPMVAGVGHDERGEHDAPFNRAVTGGIIGAGIGLVIAHLGTKTYGSHAAIGGAVGAFGGAWLGSRDAERL